MCDFGSLTIAWGLPGAPPLPALPGVTLPDPGFGVSLTPPTIPWGVPGAPPLPALPSASLPDPGFGVAIPGVTPPAWGLPGAPPLPSLPLPGFSPPCPLEN